MAFKYPVPEGGTADNIVVVGSSGNRITDKVAADALALLGITATALELSDVCAGVLSGSAVWNPGSLIDGAQESKDFTVTGAALGDFVIAGAGVDVVDILVSAVVTATNTVTVTLANETGGTVDLASSTWKVRVFKS